MKKSLNFLRNFTLLLLVLSFLASPASSQEYCLTKEEVESIKLNASVMMGTIEGQRTLIEEERKRTEKYRTLSEELRKEAETAEKSRDRWRIVAVGSICAAIAAAGVSFIATR